MSAEEKGQAAAFDVVQEDDVRNAEKQQSIDSDDEFSPEEQRRIIRRVDLRLVLTCGFMYCISLIDRTNLGAANIAGMSAELQLIEYRYSILVLVFFITYVIFQPPATVLTRKIGPRNFLAGICFLWGVTMLAHGLIRKWTDMIPLRLLLGLFEAGFFPGCLYLISTWYTRYELHKRYSGFYLVGVVCTGFAGILAYGLMQMNGIGNYSGWRWIFIMEGLLTVLISVIGYFTLVNFPDQREGHFAWKFLSQRELNWIMRRIDVDREDSEVEPFNLKKWASSGLDPKIWGFAFCYFLITTTTYSIAYFLPVILRDMGFSIAASQCLVAPPYAMSGVMMMITSWIGDKYRTKAPILIVNAVLAIIGIAVMGYGTGMGPRYFGVFLTTAAANANVPTIMTYQANNIRGQWKRAFCSASIIIGAGLGGVAGSLIFRSQDAPLYRPGVYATIVANGLVIVVSAILSIWFIICNRRADRGEMVIEGLASFRYTI